MKKFTLIIALVALAVAYPVYGAPSSVTVNLTWVPSPPGEIKATIHARNATGSSTPFEIAFPQQRGEISLAPGQWFIHASMPGFWSEPQLVSVSEEKTETTLVLYRTTRLQAQITTPRGAPKSADVYFHPTDPASRQPNGSVACPVIEGKTDCELPQGLYDLSFRVPGHASAYRWNIDLREKPIVDVGKIALRIGATLSGRVVIESNDDVSFDAVKLTLRNATGTDRNDEYRDRQSVTTMVTKPNQRGFFSFDVSPGDYFVSATAPNLAAEERRVTVIEGREAVLTEPLALQRYWTLTVNSQIPPEGAEQPWQVELTRFDLEGQPSAKRTLSVPADGISRFQKQLSGSYNVQIKLHDSVWASEQVNLDHDTTIDLPVRAMRVRGSVTLGDEPLAARLLFTSREQGFRVPVQTRPNGTFTAFLPAVKEQRWEQLEIQSTEPWVKRFLEDVPFQIGDDGRATMEIRLPSAELTGVVIDENDRPILNGLVDITAPDGVRQFETPDGNFSIHGLARGRYRLTASTRERETEEAVIVEMNDDDEKRRDVILRVVPNSQLRGSVTSALGPVFGASVFVVPANAPVSLVSMMPVDAAGEFNYRVPPRTRDIAVAVTSPGFSFRMMRMPLPEAKLELVVDQNGGTLSIDGRVGSRAEPYRPYVIHNGAILSAFTVAYLSRARLTADANQRVQFELALAEEGTYAVCLLSPAEEQGIRLGARLPESRCASGMLARHGSLKLQAPEIH